MPSRVWASPTSIWRELRRRKVVKAFLAYSAAGLVLIEGANNILPALGVSETVNRVLVWIVLVGLPIAMLLAWKFDVVPDAGEDVAVLPPSRPIDLPTDRIAVLPFRDMSAAQDDTYFADGVTEDIIAKLSTIQAFSVVSRTSVMGFRGTREPIPSIGQQLQAGSILEGSVRRVPERVRVVSQLIDVNSDRCVWTETYDREVDDLFSVQSDIATSVARGLHASLSTEDEARLTERRSADPEAYDLCLRARHLWNTRSVAGLQESQALLEKAIDLDPELALAHATLASTLATSALYNIDPAPENMPRALEAAERALVLEPELAEALNARGLVECVWSWDWERGAATFLEAAAASPSDVVARQWYSLNCLAPQGRLEEAESALAVARSLDPLSPIVQASDGFLKYLGRDGEGAQASLQPLISDAACPPIAHLFMGFVHELMEQNDAARRAFRQAKAVGGRNIEALTALASNHALSGNRREAEEMLEEIEATAARSYVTPGHLARVHAALGQWEQAQHHWTRAIEVRSADLIWVGVSPMYDFARGRPEWQAVVDAVGAMR